tara:strand:- start:971 stop:1354 length:384 start_codon:yes stop_codon:yes gene_type:complete
MIMTIRSNWKSLTKEDTHCQLCASEDDDGALLLWDDFNKHWEMLDKDGDPIYPQSPIPSAVMFYESKDWLRDDFRAYHKGAIRTPVEEQSDVQKIHFIHLENQFEVFFCENHWDSEGGEENDHANNM